MPNMVEANGRPKQTNTPTFSLLAPPYVRACRVVTEHEAGGRARGARDPLLALEAYKAGPKLVGNQVKEEKEKTEC
ncbi:hypothetical protein C0J52_24275 [Blattella germanica]|nr:hypothetical protein C0J52_24275 [Blattella germanica]